jgi:hypothetical protein
MALNRITGLGMVVLGSSMLLAVACDSGGTTTPSNAGGSSSVSGQGGSGTTGGTSSANTAISGSTGGKTSTSGATGGTSAATTSAGVTCPSSITPPTAKGSLSVSSGYVTAGTYAGYGFTWVGDKSLGDTCITPKCGTTGCVPSFGATALCGAGVVAPDADYSSITGIGFNLKQPSAGGDAGSVTAGSTVTVGVTLGTGDGDQAARVQLVDSDGNNYCAANGSWSSGSPIDIATFNTACWDGSGTSPVAGTTKIVSVHIVVPADSTVERPFSICLTDFAM